MASMASSAKTALMFALVAAMAMAAQAGSHNVSCTNQYGKVGIVNGVVIGVSLTVNIPVDDVLQSPMCVEITGDYCNCPSDVIAVTLLELGGDVVVEVTASTLPSLLNSTLHYHNPKPTPQVTFKYNYPCRLPDHKLNALIYFVNKYDK